MPTQIDVLQTKRRPALRATLSIIGIIGVFLTARAQLHGQDETPLGDVARQSRLAHTSTTGQPGSGAAATTDHWASRIQQEQDEVGSTPDRFGAYIGPGYQLWVPAPFSVIGRNDLGTLLGSSEIADLTTKVFAGAPVHMPKHLNDLQFNTWANQFWRQYGSLACGHAKAGTPYRDCNAVVSLLGYQGFGSARFVENGDELLPIVCFSTREELETIDISQPHTREERVEISEKLQRNIQRQDRMAVSGRLCTTVLDSIRIRQTTESPEAPPRRVQTTEALVRSKTHAEAEPNLAEIARDSRAKAQNEKVKLSIQEEDTAGMAPSGFRTHSGEVCAAQCWQESFSLPDGVRRVQGGKSDDVYVSTRGDLTEAVFYFAKTGAEYDYNEIGGSQEVARQWIHASVDYKSQPERSNRTINGHGAIFVRTRLVANLNRWIEEQAMITMDGFLKRIGCILPEDHFIDREWTCATVFESWEIHQ